LTILTRGFTERMARFMGAFPSIRLATAGLVLAFAAACGGKGGGGSGSDGGDGGSTPCICLPDGGFPDSGYPDGGRPDGGPCVCPPGDGSSGDGGLRLSFAQVLESFHDLELTGEFGDITTLPGGRTVRVDTMDYQPPRAEWLSPNQIRVHNFPSAGPGSAGDIQVMNGSLRSNILQLTEWRGRFTVTQFGPMIPGATAKIVFNWSVHIRASINGAAARELPGIGVDGTTCTFDADGTYDTLDGRSHVTWARNGPPNIPYDISLTTQPGSQTIYPVLDRERRALQIRFTAYVTNGLSVTVLDRMTGSMTTHQENISFSDGVRDFGIQLNPNWIIPAGIYTQPISGVFRVEWPDIVPSYPPR